MVAVPEDERESHQLGGRGLVLPRLACNVGPSLSLSWPSYRKPVSGMGLSVPSGWRSREIWLAGPPSEEESARIYILSATFRPSM